MQIGIGLPSYIRGTTLEQITEFARRAEANGFASLGTIDRLVYANYDPLIALTAAASVTRRIGLVTCVLLTAYRNTAVLAKQAASLDRLSGGRLTLGVGLGGRAEDYEAAGVTTRGRGRRLSEQLQELRRIWLGESRGFAGGIGPEPALDGGPPLLVGGDSEPALRRMARYADGFVGRAGGPSSFAQHRERAQVAWRAANRTSEPYGVGITVFGLGPQAKYEVRGVLLDYYAYAGAHAERIAASALLSVEAIQTAIEEFDAAGCDQLIISPAVPDPGQVDLLAAALKHTNVSRNLLVH
jgi:alkanesulfonate monooxygenase SsuD/methylene tetrahydromethanopterin reductase-like flavin-dependent oxidoreductase (luciferase family)